MKKLLAILFIGVCSFTAFGQLSVAPKIGLNFANVTGDLSDNSRRVRVQIGGIINYEINDMFSFQPGLMYSGKGWLFNYSSDDKDAFTINYIEIPLNVVFHYELETGSIQVFAGPYFGIVTSSVYKFLADENNETLKIEVGTSDGDEIKPTDVGINFGFGYRYEQYQAQIGYGGSLGTISNYVNDDLKNNLIYITVAYFFEID